MHFKHELMSLLITIIPTPMSKNPHPFLNSLGT